MLAVTASVSRGVLSIFGDSAANDISVVVSGTNLVVRSRVPGATVEVGRFANASVSSISTRLEGGSDRYTHARDVRKPVTVSGGAGSDYIALGDSASASIYGHYAPGTIGTGLPADDNATDILIAGGGTTSVWGQGGNDVLKDSEGGVPVGVGRTTLYGGPGDDLFVDERNDNISFTGFGESGNDTFTPKSGSGFLFDGGTNDAGRFDTVDFGPMNTTSGLEIRLDGTRGGFISVSPTLWNMVIRNCGAVFGGGGSDRLYGNNSPNLIRGGTAGNDSIWGLGGDDVLEGNNGNNFVFAGLGNDYVSLSGGNDYAQLNEGDDSCNAGAGDDTVFGGEGNDTFNGGDGSDSLLGEDGNDRMSAQSSERTRRDIYDGGAGSDRIDAGNGYDSVRAGSGNDTVNVNEGDDFVDAGSGDDSIDGGLGNDVVYARAGNDVLQGGIGNDTLFGDEDNDTLYGDRGADVLFGGIGNDLLRGDQDNDSLFGNEGNDLLDMLDSTRFDRGDGGTGTDTARGDGPTFNSNPALGDIWISIERVTLGGSLSF